MVVDSDTGVKVWDKRCVKLSSSRTFHGLSPNHILYVESSGAEICYSQSRYTIFTCTAEEMLKPP